MCGIIGYTGTEKAVPKITKGLSVLEYRGYDSVGIASSSSQGVKTLKCKGRIGDLEKKLSDSPLYDCGTAIGHTRWATHGGPSDTNAHPHRVGKTILVHNGIIENYRELREKLSDVKIISQTDTEIAAAVINEEYEKCGDAVIAIRNATDKMKGSYAFGILFEDSPENVYAARLGSPLLLAKGADGYYLASDMTAFLPFTKEYYPMGEGEIAVLTPSGVTVYSSSGASREPSWSITNITPESAERGGFPHFMLKEIYEQPEAVKKSVSPRVKNGLPDFTDDGLDAAFWNGISSVQIVGCGSAMHAGLVGVRLFEGLAKTPAASYIASEYRYHPPIADFGTLVILISQSGETADTLAALRYAKESGLPTLAIVNAVETTIAREADKRIYTHAGPEIAVATTKGYCTQVAILYMIAAAMARAKGHLSDGKAKRLAKSLRDDVPEAILSVLNNKREHIKKISAGIAARDRVFYIGRGIDFALSEEGALKLKEISYIHAEAYAAGELKHGTISLIEDGVPVIALSTDPVLYDKTETGVREVMSRGARVVLICREDANVTDGAAHEIIKLPVSSPEATLFASLTAVQLLGYEAAVLRGCDVDRPRNLAKSVTVE